MPVGGSDLRALASPVLAFAYGSFRASVGRPHGEPHCLNRDLLCPLACMFVPAGYAGGDGRQSHQQRGAVGSERAGGHLPAPGTYGLLRNKAKPPSGAHVQAICVE